MKNRKSGFTLMEIMVVIIVIAVLASVAGPMIGSITDQGRASATKSKLSSLKSALLAYQGDIGRFPFYGTSSKSQSAYNDIRLLCSDKDEYNVLVCNADLCSSSDGTTDSGIKNYSKKWKGPYMDSEASDFMVDAWGKPIRYICWNKNIYLWSYGPDLEPYKRDGSDAINLDQTFKDQSDGSTGCDDIVISLTRLKKAITGSSKYWSD